MVRVALPGVTPTPLDALPCGSMSTISVRRSAAAKLAARFTAVVVLPTPPFWLAMAMMSGRDGMGTEEGHRFSHSPRRRKKSRSTKTLGPAVYRSAAAFLDGGGQC